LNGHLCYLLVLLYVGDTKAKVDTQHEVSLFKKRA